MAIRPASPRAVKKSTLPPLESTNSLYGELVTKRRGLINRAEQLRARRMALAREARVAPDGTRHHDSNAPERDRLALVRKLLGNVADTVAPEPAAPLPSSGDVIRELTTELDAIETAIAMLVNPLNELRGEASRQVCAELRDENREHILDIVSAIQMLHGMTRAYLNFLRNIERGDYSTATLGVIPAGGLIGGPGCPLVAFIKRAKQAGYIKQSDVPDGMVL